MPSAPTMTVKVHVERAPCEHHDGYGSTLMPDGLCLLCGVTPRDRRTEALEDARATLRHLVEDATHRLAAIDAQLGDQP